MEQNEKYRGMKPERILEMFLEVANQHASKSYDFPISDVSEFDFFLNFGISFCFYPFFVVPDILIKKNEGAKCLS